MLSVGETFGNSLAGVWLWVSHEVMVKMPAPGRNRLRAGLGLESPPQDAPFQDGSLACLASLCWWTSPGLLEVLTIWWRAVPSARKNKWQWQCLQRPSLEVTRHHFAIAPWLRGVEDYTKGRSRRRGSRGPSWRLHTTPPSRKLQTAASEAALSKPLWGDKVASLEREGRSHLALPPTCCVTLSSFPSSPGLCLPSL